MQAGQFCATLLAALLAGSAASAEAQDQARQRQETPQRQMRFRGMDRDGDGVITRAEWRGSLQSFRQHDRNDDGVLSGDEVWTASPDPSAPQDLVAVFSRADRNNDRVLSRDEWYGDLATFERVDRDDDGQISFAEFLGEDVAGTAGDFEPFETLDRNRNDVITRNEWTGDLETFRTLDRDNDGVLTRSEYQAAEGSLETRSEAYRAGYDRGLTDGRQAGREDRRNNHGWDVEGQRELEQADAGYTRQLGSRSDYQAGYRAGFRRGYTLGYGPRR